MLKGSSVRTVKLVGMTKARKAKALKSYAKWFPKKVAGKKLVVKLPPCSAGLHLGRLSRPGGSPPVTDTRP